MCAINLISGVPQECFLLICMFLWLSYTFMFYLFFVLFYFCMPCDILLLLKVGYLSITLEVRFYPFLKSCCFFNCLKAMVVCLDNLPIYICKSLRSLVEGHWGFYPLAFVHPPPLCCSFPWMAGAKTKHKEATTTTTKHTSTDTKQIPRPVFVLSLCLDSSSVLIHICSELRAQPRVKLWVFFSLFWACIFLWASVWLSKLSQISGYFWMS